jgi:diguanylate cyclase (GGDEF)-like protein/PAS domain S-box-containing protein
VIDRILQTGDEQLLGALFNTIQDGLIVLDLEFNIVLANRWMERRYSSRSPLRGKKCYGALHDRHDRCPECGFSQSLVTGRPHCRVLRSSSDIDPDAWFEVSAYPLLDTDGTCIAAVEHVKDITERKRAEQLAMDEATWRRILVDQSRDGIVILDLEGKVYEANQEFARMLGYTMEEIYQLHVWDWDTHFDKDALLGMIADVDQKGAHFESSHRRKDGTVCDIELSTNGAVCSGQKLVFAVCRDITQRKILEAQIRDLAIRDPLTNVYNRRHVFERLDEIAAEYLRTGSAFCVSILDLDHFKAVNDAHGHLAGDFALKEFAETLGSLIRPYDVLGRYGGEEFVIVSRNAGAAETAAMMQRVIETVGRKSFCFETHEMHITFSCGIAESSEFEPAGFSVEAVVGLADQRLYEAKQAGRDRCIGPGSLICDHSDRQTQKVHAYS